ncbi:pyridoxal phosphate-dependent aminotransferase [Pseudovibrio exalbescens]|uniref:Aminotransferase n=1 Tax=Pseudovibrio exalbescens TaxID=197461 RepID=A0A1U7JD96_9HYPH|nr:pyridoxal phosphate-dependent aminotransferase [Pseudovibrio exalbescens]OKL42668.1 aspartate aminotransferase [Pseudovibrio exalbescens]
MRYSSFASRIGGEGSDAWDVHVKAAAAQRAGRDVVVMSVGDPDFDTPPAVRDTAIAALQAGDTHYTDVEGTPELRAEIARTFKALAGWDVTADNVCVVAGTQNGLYFAASLLCEPGEEVLVLDPCYVTYDSTIRASGAVPVRVAPHPDGGFRPDIKALASAITPATRAILITTPNNPTGTVLTKDELEAIADLAKRHDLWVISDEVYAQLTFESPNVSISALAGMKERTVTVASLSKSHAMTGWRAGWVVAPEEFIAHASNLSLCMLYGLPGFVQQAAVTALQQSPKIIGEMREVYRARRDILYSALEDIPGLTPFRPEAGMFLMAHVAGTGLTSSQFVHRLYEEQGVSVLDGAAFGPSASGYVRLSYTTHEEALQEGAKRIRAFCETLA